MAVVSHAARDPNGKAPLRECSCPSCAAIHSARFILIKAAGFSVKSAQAPRPHTQALIKTIWRGSDRVVWADLLFGEVVEIHPEVVVLDLALGGRHDLPIPRHGQESPENLSPVRSNTTHHSGRGICSSIL